MLISNFECLLCQVLCEGRNSFYFIYSSKQSNEVGIITITCNLHVEKLSLGMVKQLIQSHLVAELGNESLFQFNPNSTLLKCKV